VKRRVADFTSWKRELNCRTRLSLEIAGFTRVDGGRSGGRAGKKRQSSQRSPARVARNWPPRQDVPGVRGIHILSAAARRSRRSIQAAGLATCRPLPHTYRFLAPPGSAGGKFATWMAARMSPRSQLRQVALLYDMYRRGGYNRDPLTGSDAGTNAACLSCVQGCTKAC